ncbi:hypothetical protein D915_005181 [Fasciola hepatica]|uniref:Uncharacterized protein n=1 Tax=Fasciola hepatica TaxID=6192 RepID=A0A4E0RTH3_FASHE|nr:hypothetical protein D915_005181 [Fasciola hepatica]
MLFSVNPIRCSVLVNVIIFTIMIRGRYSCADEGVRKRVIQAFEDGHDWRVLAKPNGVKYKTAYNWVHADKLRYERQPRDGLRRKSLNGTEIDEMITWVEEGSNSDTRSTSYPSEIRN